MSTINTADAKWQSNDKFKPDKDDHWKYPADKDGWVKAHNTIRDEINSFTHSLTSISNKYPSSSSPIPSWAVASIQTFWSHHEEFVHLHHCNEDDIVNPFMKTRVNLPDKLEADHIVVIDRMNNVSNMIKKLNHENGGSTGSTTTTSSTIDELISAMSLYKETMLPHLLEEEMIALPLLRSYFKPKEFRPTLLKMLKKSTKGETGSFIHSMGKDYFRSTFMKQEGIPFFLWYLKFKSDYNYFLKNVQCHIHALNEGQPIITNIKCTAIC